MREQMSRHVTMVTPAPGFTMRVMARIQERERQAARRRALVGAGLLALAGVAPFVLVGIGLASLWIVLSSAPDWLTSGIVAVSPALDLVGTILTALWLAGGAIVSLGSAQIVVYALVVLALTLLWVRVAGGSFQLAPHTVDMGGS